MGTERRGVSAGGCGGPARFLLHPVTPCSLRKPWAKPRLSPGDLGGWWPVTTPLPVSGTPAPRTGQPDASATVLAFLTHTSRQSCAPALRGALGLGRGASHGGHGAAPGVCVADGQPGQGGPRGHFMTHPVSGCGASQTEDRRSPRARGQRKWRPRRPSTGFSHGRDPRWRPRPQEAGPPALSPQPPRGAWPGPAAAPASPPRGPAGPDHAVAERRSCRGPCR